MHKIIQQPSLARVTISEGEVREGDGQCGPLDQPPGTRSAGGDGAANLLTKRERKITTKAALYRIGKGFWAWLWWSGPDRANSHSFATGVGGAGNEATISDNDA